MTLTPGLIDLMVRWWDKGTKVGDISIALGIDANTVARVVWRAKQHQKKWRSRR